MSANTSSSVELASELLTDCLEGRRWPDSLLDALLRRALSNDRDEARDASRALFGIVVERLADLFEPRLCDEYAGLFSEVIQRVRGDLNADEVRHRYQRTRAAKPFSGKDPEAVYVLSRVTLGADVAVTSVVLDAMKKRFPRVPVCFVGSKKNWALFEADPRVDFLEYSYGRSGTLRERISSVPILPGEDVIVVDPDSRLTQLGLLPVCDERRYYFFESRAYGRDSDRTLRELTAEWVAHVFGIRDARAYVAPAGMESRAEITVSFGVGENDEKRVSEEFEAAVLAELTRAGRKVLLDTGAGGEERDRAERLARNCPGDVALWRGDYAPFASAIAQSRLYVGYDSAGQHVAAASGVPLVSIFAGYASERMFQRWQPSGNGPVKIVKVSDRDAKSLLQDTVQAFRQLSPNFSP